MPVTEFNVGDRVIVSRESPWRRESCGGRGIVLSCNGTHTAVRFDGGSNLYIDTRHVRRDGMREHTEPLRELEVGDRVRISLNSQYYGVQAVDQQGEITRVGGYSCDVLFNNGYTNNYEKVDLELVENEENTMQTNGMTQEEYDNIKEGCVFEKIRGDNIGRKYVVSSVVDGGMYLYYMINNDYIDSIGRSPSSIKNHFKIIGQLKSRVRFGKMKFNLKTSYDKEKEKTVVNITIDKGLQSLIKKGLSVTNAGVTESSFQDYDYKRYRIVDGLNSVLNSSSRVLFCKDLVDNRKLSFNTAYIRDVLQCFSEIKHKIKEIKKFFKKNEIKVFLKAEATTEEEPEEERVTLGGDTGATVRVRATRGDDGQLTFTAVQEARRDHFERPMGIGEENE